MRKLHLCIKEGLKTWFHFGSVRYSGIKLMIQSCLWIGDPSWVNTCMKKNHQHFWIHGQPYQNESNPWSLLNCQEELWAGCLTELWALPPPGLQELLKQLPSVTVIFDTLLATKTGKYGRMQNSNSMQIADKKSLFFTKPQLAQRVMMETKLYFYLNQYFILGFKISQLHQRLDCSSWVTVTISA